MFRNYLVAALRNLARNKFYSAINIVGLAVAFATAILIGLYVRDELSYDSWLPLHERTYLLNTTLAFPGHAVETWDFAPYYFAAPMKRDFAQIEAVARLMSGRGVIVGHGQIENNEDVYWADPNIFDLLRLPAIAGDLRTALSTPDGIVLTRKMARKYFGRDAPIGETLQLNRQYPMRVTAVLEDLPSNTHLDREIFVSGLAAFSNLARANASKPSGFVPDCLTYLRLRPGASSAALEEAIPAFVAQNGFPRMPGLYPTMSVSPLTAIHMGPGAAEGDFGNTKPRGHMQTVLGIAAVGILIVFIACINFVNLMTARASQRATEVGIRKVAGARRRDLIFQFMGETLLFVTFGTVLALALAELLLPSLNAFLDRTIAFDWRRDGADVALFFGFGLLIAVIAGVYPALVLSAFRPASVIKSDSFAGGGPGTARRVLVMVQFAILTGLILLTAIIYRQTQFALNEGMRLDMDQVYVIPSGCLKDAFKNEITSLPGVRNVACSSLNALDFGEVVVPVKLADGTSILVDQHPVGFGFFGFYGLRPVAGRFFAEDHAGDAVPADPKAAMSAPVVINEAAARRFGFATPQAAVGQSVSVGNVRDEAGHSEIIGIAPDFSVDAVHTRVPPIVYFIDGMQKETLSIKLFGRDMPETLQSIGSLWDKTGTIAQLRPFFLDQRVQVLYRDILQQGALFAVFSGVALFIGCIGLVGLSAYAAARRTKEIGIRKSMGAKTGDILRLLTWEFAKPVLWANLIAWPIAYFAMNRWLSGFAYHIDLAPWMFFAAGAAALFIALVTVSVQSLITAREKPIAALRYE